MAQNIIEVLQRIVLVNTHPISTEKKLIIILSKLPIYYNKKKIFSDPAVLAKIDTAPELIFLYTWGNNDKPNSTH